jgi:hypothetical protein
MSLEDNNGTRIYSGYKFRTTMEQEHIPDVKSGQQRKITHSRCHVRTTM